MWTPVTVKTQRMSGKVLQAAIIDLAKLNGWRTAHFPSVLVTGRDGRPTYRTALAAQAKGFPDCVFVRDKVIVAEIKGDGDKLRPDQEEWLDAFQVAGVEAYVWTPAMWRLGAIEKALK